MSNRFHNFELRYFSKDIKANGETDFKGETSVLDTEQRIQFLQEYAKQTEMNLKDVDLFRPLVSAEETKLALSKIKPQPRPVRRKRIMLEDWKWMGYRKKGAEEQQQRKLKWESMEHISIENGLYFAKDRSIHFDIPLQDWRCFFEWSLSGSSHYEHCEFSLGEAVIIGFDEERKLYYKTNGKKVMGGFTEDDIVIRVEMDFVYRKFNLYINKQLVADFIAFSDVTKNVFAKWSISGRSGLKINHVWGVGYKKLDENSREPFSIRTIIDEDFQVPPEMDQWQQEFYNDKQWTTGKLPIVHGGERFVGEDIYMRKSVTIDKIPACAELYMESLTPGGELYINGELVEVIKDECMHKVDVTSFLKAGQNLIAVKVYADKLNEKFRTPHSHTDSYTGWFAGRMHLDLLPEIYIEDVFSYTESIHEYSAIQKVNISVKALQGISSKSTMGHTLRIKMMPWFPEEGPLCAEASMSTPVHANMIETTNTLLEINSPHLWSTVSPNLYKVVVELYDHQFVLCDDFVITTGIRTVSQEGGVFRINGKPELLRAPLLFGARPPLDKIAAWEKCPPVEFYIEEMLMVRKMNGNGIRMSVHDEQIGGINDPRICELADQLGMMLVWQTSAWLRETSATNLDLKKLKSDIIQVRNHCSIVIWQPSNHPSWKSWEIVMKMYRMIYETITAVDISRLISPSADSRRIRPYNDAGTIDYEGNPVEYCDPIWTAPLICRGNMDYISGYGNEWSALRQWPNVEEHHLPEYMETTAYIQSFLDSKERAYFNFEHDETAGQPNWELHKGKPNYHVKGYEWQYEEGSIGRILDFSEWKISQAWQAFSAYETIRKSLWLGYDGLSWCCLRGGGNTATYQKPLVDYYGQPKLAYYIHRMAFQEVLAGSHNVDIVYGPDDEIPVMICNLGDEKLVTLTVIIKSVNQEVIDQAIYENVLLPGGRSVTQLEPFKPHFQNEGLYSIHYHIVQHA